MNPHLLALRFRFLFNAEGGGGGATAQTTGDNTQQTQQTQQTTGDNTQQTTDAAKPWWDGVVTDAPVLELMQAKQYKSPAELAVAYYNANKMISGGVVTIPGDDAPPEVIEKFHEKLGRPAKPEDYKLDFGEGVTVDEGLATFGKTLFHKMGLNPKQAQAAAGMWQDYVKEENAKRAETWRAENEAAVNALKSRWGAEFDANLAAGKRAYSALGLSAELVGAIEAHMGTAPVVELIAMIGKATGEGGFKGPAQGGGGGAVTDPKTMTPQQAQAEIDRLRGDAEFDKMFNDARHPQHKEAVDKMAALYARL